MSAPAQADTANSDPPAPPLDTAQERKVGGALNRDTADALTSSAMASVAIGFARKARLCRIA
jgi:hypothetical protein